MKIEESSTQRQYHYEDLHRTVKIEKRVTIQDVREKPPSPLAKSQDDDPFATEKLKQMRKDALDAVFGEGLDWRELSFRRNEKDGAMYVSVIERATGRVLRVIKEHSLDAMLEGLRAGAGKTIDISG
ncbi:MAG: flagellar protein FlaG [Proteobacteria bacterium]|nr:flagellar protein FlaG [Pseudomonadota bacterium]